MFKSIRNSLCKAMASLLVLVSPSLFAAEHQIVIEHSDNSFIEVKSAKLLNPEACSEFKFDKLVVSQYDLVFMTDYSGEEGQGNRFMLFKRKSTISGGRLKNVPVSCSFEIEFKPLNNKSVVFNNYITKGKFDIAGNHVFAFDIEARTSAGGSKTVKNNYRTPWSNKDRKNDDIGTLNMSLMVGGPKVFPCGKTSKLYLDFKYDILNAASRGLGSWFKLWGNFEEGGKNGFRLSLFDEDC